MPKSPKDTVGYFMIFVSLLMGTDYDFLFLLAFSSPQTCVCGCGIDMKASAIVFPELVHDLLIGDAVLLDEDGEKSKWSKGEAFCTCLSASLYLFLFVSEYMNLFVKALIFPQSCMHMQRLTTNFKSSPT